MTQQTTPSRPAADDPCSEEIGLYLFCFARRGCTDGQAEPDIEGYGPLREQAAGGVAAIFCQVRLAGFRNMEAAGNLKWIAPRAMMHDRIIRSIMERSPVLPVKFGAIFSSGQALVELLERVGDQVAEFLDQIQGHQEWSVKAYVKEAEGVAWAAADDPELARRREKIANLPAGARYLRQRQLDMKLQEQVGDWWTRVAVRLEEALGRLELPSRELRLYGPKATGQGGRMVFHRAYLVPSERVEELERQARRLGDEIHLDALRVEVSGPWPPYNFCPAVQESGD